MRAGVRVIVRGPGHSPRTSPQWGIVRAALRALLRGGGALCAQDAPPCLRATFEVTLCVHVVDER